MNVISASDRGALAGMLDAGWSVAGTGRRGGRRDPRGRARARRRRRRRVRAPFRRRALRLLEAARARFRCSKARGRWSRARSPRRWSSRGSASRAFTSASASPTSRTSRKTERGTRCGAGRLRSVAVYAPASSAAVAVLMGRRSGKDRRRRTRRRAVTPPAREAMSAPRCSFACALCGVDELYAAGGAQAIAAAAFGTDSIAPVDKIVGRGGVWTTEAKRQVFGRCGIDALAGPAEVLIVADDGANSEYVVGELLAQAERPRASRLAVLSESRPLLEAVAQLVDTLDLRTLERNEFVSEAIANALPPDRGERRETSSSRWSTASRRRISRLQVRDASAYLDRDLMRPAPCSSAT